MAKINHFIVLLLENRSFDHIFGFAQPSAGQQIDNIAAMAEAPSNLLDPTKAEGRSNPAFPASQPAPFVVHDKNGPSHSFNAVNTQLAGSNAGPTDQNPASNIGFVKSWADELKRVSHDVSKEHVAEVMLSFAPDQLPAINQLAAEFCLCDQWHCEVPGPTMPNRMFFHAATSEGYAHNAFKRPFTSKTVYQLLEGKGLAWACYFHDLNDLMQFSALERTPAHFRRFDKWAADVAAGNLPTYTFLFPRFMNGKDANGDALMANSQHAPEDARFAEHLIADVYDALAANHNLFKESALIVTYDEHGGFHDHVIPGAAPNPDGQDSPNPDDTAGFAPVFSFDRIGLRVPAVIASPWVPKGHVEHRKLQHTSVIKTLTEIYGLDGPLNQRDASAASFADLFDKLQHPRAAADMPAKLTRPALDDATESVVAGVEQDPADHALDSLTEDWARGMLSLMGGGGLESVAVAAAPETQGEAAAAIDQQLKAMGL